MNIIYSSTIYTHYKLTHILSYHLQLSLYLYPHLSNRNLFASLSTQIHSHTHYLSIITMLIYLLISNSIPSNILSNSYTHLPLSITYLCSTSIMISNNSSMPIYFFASTYASIQIDSSNYVISILTISTSISVSHTYLFSSSIIAFNSIVPSIHSYLTLFITHLSSTDNLLSFCSFTTHLSLMMIIMSLLLSLMSHLITLIMSPIYFHLFQKNTFTDLYMNHSHSLMHHSNYLILIFTMITAKFFQYIVNFKLISNLI